MRLALQRDAESRGLPVSDPAQGTRRLPHRRLLELAVIGAVLLVLGSILAVAVLRVRDAADRVSCNLGGVAVASTRFLRLRFELER